MPSNHLILCRTLLLLPSVLPSIRVFSNESALRIRWPKYWSFSFSISPSNECSGLISFRMDWLDLLAIQGTLKSLLQYHSSKASILQCSAFFIVQLSHPSVTIADQIVLSFFCQLACLQFGSGVFFIGLTFWCNNVFLAYLVCFWPQICNQWFLSGALLPCSNPSPVTLCCMSVFTERIAPVYRIFTLSFAVWDFHMMHNLYLWAHLPQEF